MPALFVIWQLILRFNFHRTYWIDGIINSNVQICKMVKMCAVWGETGHRKWGRAECVWCIWRQSNFAPLLTVGLRGKHRHSKQNNKWTHLAPCARHERHSHQIQYTIKRTKHFRMLILCTQCAAHTPDHAHFPNETIPFLRPAPLYTSFDIYMCSNSFHDDFTLFIFFDSAHKVCLWFDIHPQIQNEEKWNVYFLGLLSSSASPFPNRSLWLWMINRNSYRNRKCCLFMLVWCKWAQKRNVEWASFGAGCVIRARDFVMHAIYSTDRDVCVCAPNKQHSQPNAIAFPIECDF